MVKELTDGLDDAERQRRVETLGAEFEQRLDEAHLSVDGAGAAHQGAAGDAAQVQVEAHQSVAQADAQPAAYQRRVAPDAQARQSVAQVGHGARSHLPSPKKTNQFTAPTVDGQSLAVVSSNQGHPY